MMLGAVPWLGVYGSRKHLFVVLALHLLGLWSTVIAWPTSSSFRLRERQLHHPHVLKLAVPYSATTPEAASNRDVVDDDYSIRDCVHADLTSICDLVMESFFHHQHDQNGWDKEYQKLETTFQDMTMQNHWNSVQQKQEQPPQQNYMIVACQVPTYKYKRDIDNHKIIGFVHLDRRPPPTNVCLKHCPRPIVTDLMVSKSMRRKGIARRLMTVCEEIARPDCPSLYLRVMDSNHVAIQFYNRIGFQYRPDMCEDSRPDLMMFEKTLSP